MSLAFEKKNYSSLEKKWVG